MLSKNSHWMLGLALLSAVRNAAAFEQCPIHTLPCVGFDQALLYVVVPSVGFALVAAACMRWLRRAIARRAAVALVLATWVMWLVFAWAAFNAFLAPCSSTCWYRGTPQLRSSNP